MKSLLKVFVFLAALVVFSPVAVVSSANAQIGGYTYAYCNGAWVPGSCNGVAAGMGGIPMGVIPTSGLTRCELLGGIAGGTLGSLAKNHTGQATILGAIIGGIAGNTLCQSNSGQVVTYQQHQQYQRLPQRSQVTQVSTNQCSNACADQPGRIPVYRANGSLACRLADRPAEPGERSACNTESSSN